MSIPLSLEDRVALVTGGSRGIGAAVVHMFVGAGAKVIFNYQKSKAQADSLIAECGAEKCAAVACDLSGTETAHALVDATVATFGRLDVLICNHGIWESQDVPIERMAEQQWERTFAVNL